jgi:RND family efflux transporter MFP subunit
MLATALALVIGCGERKSSSIQVRLGEKVVAGSIPVETLVLRPQNFEDRFEAPGAIEAVDDVTVSAEVAARITKIGHEIGDEVDEGDVLVALDTASIQARIRKIEAEIARVETMLDKSKRDLTREQSLFETKVSAERAFDDAKSAVAMNEAELAAAKADLELARVDLAKHTIRSPITGTISAKHVSLGEYVNPGTNLYGIVKTEEVKFVISLSEFDVTRVRVGDTLPLGIDSFLGKRLEGKVRGIAPSGNERTRTFRAELIVPNPHPHDLRPGMSGRAEIVRNRYEGIYLLPEESILHDESKSFIYLVRSESAAEQGEGAGRVLKAAPINVRIIASVGAKAVVMGDFPPEASSIILGQYAVQPGSPIVVRRAHEAIPEVKFD